MGAGTVGDAIDDVAGGEAAPVAEGRTARRAAAIGSVVTTLAYLVVTFPLAMGVVAAASTSGAEDAVGAFGQGVLLGWMVSIVWFLWLLCAVVAAAIGFPLAWAVERGLRRAGLERWRPLAMGLLGGAIGAVLLLAYTLIAMQSIAFGGAVEPWIVVIVAGAVASGLGHWLADTWSRRRRRAQAPAAVEDAPA